MLHPGYLFYTNVISIDIFVKNTQFDAFSIHWHASTPQCGRPVCLDRCESVCLYTVIGVFWEIIKIWNFSSGLFSDRNWGSIYNMLAIEPLLLTETNPRLIFFKLFLIYRDTGMKTAQISAHTNIAPVNVYHEHTRVPVNQKNLKIVIWFFFVRNWGSISTMFTPISNKNKTPSDMFQTFLISWDTCMKTAHMSTHTDIAPLNVYHEHTRFRRNKNFEKCHLDFFC